MSGTIRYFLAILCAGLASAFLGGGFGALVAMISPEFVRELFYVREGVSVTRYAFAMGMIWGLFIGAAVGGFSVFLSMLAKFLKIRKGSDGEEN